MEKIKKIIDEYNQLSMKDKLIALEMIISNNTNYNIALSYRNAGVQNYEMQSLYYLYDFIINILSEIDDINMINNIVNDIKFNNCNIEKYDKNDFDDNGINKYCDKIYKVNNDIYMKDAIVIISNGQIVNSDNNCVLINNINIHTDQKINKYPFKPKTFFINLNNNINNNVISDIYNYFGGIV